jgi:hypothetical protein
VLGAGTPSASVLSGGLSAPPGGSLAGGPRVAALSGGSLAAALAGGPRLGECDGLRWARHELAGPGWLLVALGTDPVALSRVLSGSGSAGERGSGATGPGGSGPCGAAGTVAHRSDVLAVPAPPMG